MIAGGREVPMLYTHGINDEARRRLTVVPAGGHASLRLDRSGPFCQPLEGALELAIEPRACRRGAAAVVDLLDAPPEGDYADDQVAEAPNQIGGQDQPTEPGMGVPGGRLDNDDLLRELGELHGPSTSAGLPVPVEAYAVELVTTPSSG
jgi:hypothetical protein